MMARKGSEEPAFYPCRPCPAIQVEFLPVFWSGNLQVDVEFVQFQLPEGIILWRSIHQVLNVHFKVCMMGNGKPPSQCILEHLVPKASHQFDYYHKISFIEPSFTRAFRGNSNVIRVISFVLRSGCRNTKVRSILYRLLTSCPAFAGNGWRSVCQSLSGPCRRIFRRSAEVFSLPGQGIRNNYRSL